MNAKVAIPYEDGKIFAHFGHSAQFKLYDIVDGRITASEVVAADGTGHDEIGLWLIQHEVSAVICANIGPAAQGILRVAGIVTYLGVEGDADTAVASFIAGKLDSSLPANCTHGHGGGCHSHCGSGCGGHGGCHGCCH